MSTRWLTPAFAAFAAFAAGRITAPASERPSTAPPSEALSGPASADTSQRCDTQRERVVGQREHLKSEIEVARMELRMQVAARKAREGSAQPWTDDIDPRLQPDNFEALVREAADAVGGYGELDMDCDEFPCLVALTFDRTQDLVGSPIDLEPLWQALTKRGIGEIQPQVQVSSIPRQHAVFALLPENASEELQKRTSFRMDRLYELRVEQLKESGE